MQQPVISMWSHVEASLLLLVVLRCVGENPKSCGVEIQSDMEACFMREFTCFLPKEIMFTAVNFEETASEPLAALTHNVVKRIYNYLLVGLRSTA